MGMLDRQLQTLGREFEENGGFSERLRTMRKNARNGDPGLRSH